MLILGTIRHIFMPFMGCLQAEQNGRALAVGNLDSAFAACSCSSTSDTEINNKNLLHILIIHIDIDIYTFTYT